MGKYFRHLYPQICDWGNLWLAWRKARRGKRSQPPAATFEMNLDYNLLALQADLEERCYRPGSYVTFAIHEPKPR